jgi:hypothetical protein
VQLDNSHSCALQPIFDEFFPELFKHLTGGTWKEAVAAIRRKTKDQKITGALMGVNKMIRDVSVSRVIGHVHVCDWKPCRNEGNKQNIPSSTVQSASKPLSRYRPADSLEDRGAMRVRGYLLHLLHCNVRLGNNLASSAIGIHD